MSTSSGSLENMRKKGRTRTMPARAKTVQPMKASVMPSLAAFSALLRSLAPSLRAMRLPTPTAVPMETELIRFCRGKARLTAVRAVSLYWETKMESTMLYKASTSMLSMMGRLMVMTRRGTGSTPILFSFSISGMLCILGITPACVYRHGHDTVPLATIFSVREESVMIVCKFGGSSVATGAQIQKVKAIVMAKDERQIVVVSAPGRRAKGDTKVTDLLYRCNDAVRAGGSCREIFHEVEERYLEIAKDLKLDKKALQPILDDVRQRIDAGSGPDFAASRGEHLNARLIAKYLGFEFLDTESLIIIKSDGTVDPRTYDLIARAVKPGKRYVVPGFYGSNIEGKIKTFARGGSDITGSIFARALGAILYENWTDVSGVYAANPLVVSDAKPVGTMTYQEMRELSGVGAGVFQEEAVEPVYGSDIVINVKNTNAPEEPGTLVVPSREGDDLVGLSAKSGFSRITVRKLMLFRQRGIRHALLTMMVVFGVRPTFSCYGIDSIVWYFDAKTASDSVLKMMCDRLVSEFQLNSAVVEKGYSVLGVVGQGVNDHPEIVGACSDALQEAGIKPAFINYGSSELSMLIGLPEGTEDKAQQALYHKLFH